MHVTGAPDSLLQLLEIRALSVDDLSTVRYVVSKAFLHTAHQHYSAAQAEAFCGFIRSPHFADLLLGNRPYGAWVGSEMVGVAAWSIGEPKSPTARILAVYVHPLFGGQGIGTRLGDYLADEARAAGYRALEASVTLNATGFFERLGFLKVRRTTSRLPSGRELEVVQMRKAADTRRETTH